MCKLSTIFERSCSLSLILKLIIFAIYLFFQKCFLSLFLLLLFSQQGYHFKKTGLLICSASEIGMIIFRPLIGELLAARKVSTCYGSDLVCDQFVVIIV